MTQTVIDENNTPHYFPDDATPDEMNAAIDSIQQPSFSQNVKTDITKRAIDTLSNIDKGSLGFIQLTGQGAGLAGDVLKEGVKSLTPDVVKQGIQSAGEWAGDKLLNSGAAPSINAAANDIKGGWDKFAQKFPTGARNIQAGGNILSIAPVLEGSANLISAGKDVLGNMGEESGVSTNAALAGFPAGYEKLKPVVQTSDAINATNSGLKTAKTAAYDNAKAAGAVLTPEASNHVSISVPSEVEGKLNTRLDNGIYPQTKAALNDLQRNADIGLNTNDLESTRIKLNQILQGSASGGDKQAAIFAKNALDNVSSQIEQNPNMLVSKNPAAIQAFRDAREANSVYQRHSDIADIVNDARGNPAKIQSAFQKLVSSKKENDFNRFSPDEQAIIEKVAYPNGQDTKLAGNTLGEKVSHGVGVIGKTIGGAVAGGEVGHPVIGGTLGAAAAGYSAFNDAIKSANILKGADTLLKTISSKAKPTTQSTFNAKYARGKI